jgi:type I restriction enzyme S subunit
VPHIRPMNIDREGRLDLNLLKYVDGEIPRELEKGDVLFNNTNSPDLVGKTTAVLVDTRVAYSNHMTRIRLADGLSPVFVARQLHFLWMCGYFRHRCVNSVNQASISPDPLSETVPFLLPPAAEQERVADALDELLSDLDAGVAALERVREKLKLYRASVLKAAGLGTAKAHPRRTPPQLGGRAAPKVQRERPRAAQGLETEIRGASGARQSTTAAGWVVLGDGRAVFITYPVWQLGENKRRYARRPGSQNGKFDSDGRITVDDLKYFPIDHPAFPDLLLAQGDLLFNCTNSAELVGKTAVYTGLPAPCSFASYLIRVRPLLGILPAILMFSLNGGFGRTWVKKVVNQTVGQANVNGTKLAAFTFPLPPIAEQEAIVEAAEDQLSVIDHLEADIDSKLKTAQAPRQAILRHAFTGKLVSQDPNDEPASELLKRIMAEREARTREATTAKRAAKKVNGAWRRRPVEQKKKEQVG